MKERPILFSGPMVRAILDGRKTQTRRVVKPQPVDVDNYDGAALLTFSDAEGAPSFHIGPKPDGFPCPYGQPGDRLWVKETFRLFDSHAECSCYDGCQCSGAHGKPVYRADGDHDAKWKPSIFMRREFSRITLEIESVRVERLQAITGEDAIADGIDMTGAPMDGTRGELADWAIRKYRQLWTSINGSGSWDLNPWVWVVTFNRIKP